MNPSPSNPSAEELPSPPQKCRLATWGKRCGFLAAGALPLYIFLIFTRIVFRHERMVLLGPLIFLIALLAVVLGSVAEFKIKRSRGKFGGLKQAGIGMSLGWMCMLISLLAAIAVPSFMPARMRANASGVLHDMRMTDAAKDQYALENSKKPNERVAWNDLAPYLKGTRWATCNGKDLVGNPILFGPTVSDRVHVHSRTKEALKDAADDGFWGPYS